MSDEAICITGFQNKSSGWSINGWQSTRGLRQVLLAKESEHCSITIFFGESPKSHPVSHASFVAAAGCAGAQPRDERQQRSQEEVHRTIRALGGILSFHTAGTKTGVIHLKLIKTYKDWALYIPELCIFTSNHLQSWNSSYTTVSLISFSINSLFNISFSSLLTIFSTDQKQFALCWDFILFPKMICIPQVCYKSCH